MRVATTFFPHPIDGRLVEFSIGVAKIQFLAKEKEK
jgi:hypothetical protein